VSPSQCCLRRLRDINQDANTAKFTRPAQNCPAQTALAAPMRTQWHAMELCLDNVDSDYVAVMTTFWSCGTDDHRLVVSITVDPINGMPIV
jgi:hypothetical protein